MTDTVLPLRIRHILYMWCPRGSGDIEDHRRKFLVHTVINGNMCCMDVELYEQARKEGWAP